MTDGKLYGKRILVVEDDVLIALDIAEFLRSAGAQVVGPCVSLHAAQTAAISDVLDLAILDIDLGPSEVFPAAHQLRQRGIPFVFHTGRTDREALRVDFAGVPVCPKPGSPSRIVDVLAHLLPIAA